MRSTVFQLSASNRVLLRLLITVVRYNTWPINMEEPIDIFTSKIQKMSYNFTGNPNVQPVQQGSTVYPPPGNDPFHRSYLGYQVYDRHYDDAYTAPRGCCGMPVAFWLWLFGIFFPVLWLPALCCMFSRNPYERRWSRAALFSLLLYILLAIVFGVMGGTRWNRRRYYY